MRKLEIEIPNDKEIDWETSANQKQIVFKDKKFTYNDMCQELFKNGYCYLSAYGQIEANGRNERFRTDPSNAKTTHQLECILAKNKLANVARYLNGDWDYYKLLGEFLVCINNCSYFFDPILCKNNTFLLFLAY